MIKRCSAVVICHYVASFCEMDCCSIPDLRASVSRSFVKKNDGFVFAHFEQVCSVMDSMGPSCMPSNNAKNMPVHVTPERLFPLRTFLGQECRFTDKEWVFLIVCGSQEY